METRISWFALVAMIALLYVIIKGLANPVSRPFVVGIGVLVLMGVVLISFIAVRTDRVEEPARRVAEFQHDETQMEAKAMRNHTRMMARLQTEKTTAQPALSPPETSTVVVAPRPKMTMIAALGDAVYHAWLARGSVPVAPSPIQAEKPIPRDVPTPDPPPDWVHAEPGMQGGRYVTTVTVDSYTTKIECERELPKEIQRALSEYAELSFGPEAAAVSLPDDDLKKLVSLRWTESRPSDIGGTSQNMYTLHAQVVFDEHLQQIVKSAAERLVIEKRLQGTAVLFSGFLGLLALAWGGLRFATRPAQPGSSPR